MKVAIMQPYFLPYIGYFQLIAAVDRFVIYDNIKYTKKGWIKKYRVGKMTIIETTATLTTSSRNEPTSRQAERRGASLS
jgi:hypothetical protein